MALKLGEPGGKKNSLRERRGLGGLNGLTVQPDAQLSSSSSSTKTFSNFLGKLSPKTVWSKSSKTSPKQDLSLDTGHQLLGAVERLGYAIPSAHKNLKDFNKRLQSLIAEVVADKRCIDDTVESLQQMALLLGKDGKHASKFDDVVKCLREAVKLRPDDLDIAFKLGVGYYKAAKYSEAAAAFRTGLESANTPDVTPVGSRNSSRCSTPDGPQGNRPPALLVREPSPSAATIDRRRSTPPGSAKSAGGDTPRFDGITAPKAPLRARCYVNLGVALEAQEKLEEAVEAYKGALSVHADYPAALKLAGGVYLALGKMSSAENALSRAVFLQPDFADAWTDLGTVRRWLQDPHGALKALLQATQLRPDGVIGWWSLAHAQRDCSVYAEALATLEKVLELQPSMWAAHVQQGLCSLLHGANSVRVLADLRAASSKARSPPLPFRCARSPGGLAACELCSI
ncbi:hypothetical protein CYMTET_33275 [Cymbomonas tetramitiformis]|uniref:Uncharacterized protein n=1 Tax=Cymbomonas tetramitiformis TaxID=36881 RepID=A0AAE0FE03_9CHLO|nr:hypothetical protein CYMTET_33275 [Cymbomonas tetramitiformis]